MWFGHASENALLYEGGNRVAGPGLIQHTLNRFNARQWYVPLRAFAFRRWTVDAFDPPFSPLHAQTMDRSIIALLGSFPEKHRRRSA